MGTVELALLIMTGVSEAVKLGQELIARSERGEITPEEAAAEWQKVRGGWGNAWNDWLDAKGPGG